MVSLRRPRIAGGKWIVEGTVSAIGRLTDDLRKFVLDRRHVRSLLIAVELVAAMTLLLLGVTSLIELHHVSSAYLIPVLIAAIRLGMVPALVAACGGVGASAFFFYPPIYDFRVHNPEQLLDLPLFVIVAMVTSQLAARAQANARLAQDREAEMRSLYAFSRRLAVATDAAEIWARADWQAREEILRTARWLVDMGRHHAPTTAKKARLKKAVRRASAARARNRPADASVYGEFEANAG